MNPQDYIDYLVDNLAQKIQGEQEIYTKIGLERENQVAKSAMEEIIKRQEIEKNRGKQLESQKIALDNTEMLEHENKSAMKEIITQHEIAKFKRRALESQEFALNALNNTETTAENLDSLSSRLAHILQAEQEKFMKDQEDKDKIEATKQRILSAQLKADAQNRLKIERIKISEENVEKQPTMNELVDRFTTLRKGDKESIPGTLGYLMEKLLPYYIENPEIAISADDQVLWDFTTKKRGCNEKHEYTTEIVDTDMEMTNCITFNIKGKEAPADTLRKLDNVTQGTLMEETMEDFLGKLNNLPDLEAITMIVKDHKHLKTYHCFYSTNCLNSSIWFDYETLKSKLGIINMSSLECLFTDYNKQIKRCKITFEKFSSLYLRNIDPENILKSLKK